MLRFEASGVELQQLTNSMTVNETYFFREEYQFECLARSILPEIVGRKGDKQPIRIWAIPSSSGEEPYSIALYMLEHWAGLRDWDIQILSSDIDTEILARARQGLYSDRSVQHLPEPLLRKYFKRAAGGHQICDDLRNAV